MGPVCFPGDLDRLHSVAGLEDCVPALFENAARQSAQ